MFIIIIVVIGIILYLSNLNSRINNLENKFKNLNTVPKSEDASVSIPETRSYIDLPETETSKAPTPHQDNFAQNLAKFGIAILILGVVFFLNYLDKQGFIGPVFKYVAGLSFGVVLVGIAEYLKNKSRKYTNLLRGAAFIIFYITLFVGYMLFKIVTLPLTLGLVLTVLAISIIISIRENDELPFTLGVLGAYVVSFLVNVNFYNLNQENTLGILLYVLILNIAVLMIAFSKQWINSAVIGFIFTWIIFVSTMSADIGKSMLFIFATLFGLQYLIIFLLQDFKKDKLMKNTVFLTAINTLVYLMIFYKLVVGTIWFDYVGFLVALLGVFHFLIYIMMRGINNTSEGVISLTHFVISILLVTVAVPLQFDGPLVTMIWFFEGVVLSFLSVLKDFKNKPIMYVLGFGSVIAGIAHMIMFGDYENVRDTGRIFLNQSYIVWFGVFVLINVVAYVWYDTVKNSENIIFKNNVAKAAFSFILIGQVMFVILTSYEINSFGGYRVNKVQNEINTQIDLDRKLNPDQSMYSYSPEKYAVERNEMAGIEKQTTFMQILLFIFMTIIYFIIGLIKKNKIVRNMGIVTLVITSILLITLTWQLGPVYRIITFVGFGILLLIISYLYISKNKKPSISSALMMFLMIGLFALTTQAKVIDIRDWTYFAELQASRIDNTLDNQNLYVLPIDKDVINFSKKNDLTDIRIIDNNQNEIPYIIVKSNKNTQNINQEKVEVKILENSIDRNKKQILVLDTNKEGLIYNKLILVKDPVSVNFRKKVKIYISDTFLTSTSPSWKELEQKKVIYNYTDTNSFVVEDLDISLSGISSRYVKLELTDDVEFDKNIKVNNRISVKSVEVLYMKGEYGESGYKVKDYLGGNFIFDNLLVYKDINLLNNITNENKSELIFEGNIDVEEIALKIDSNNDFNRNIVVQGSNDDIEWVTLANGNIYRINAPIYKGEKLNIQIPVSTYKKFKIIIQNNNNNPLDFSKTAKVKIQNTGVIFKLEDGSDISGLRIVVGNNTELAPIYDMQSIINYFEEVTPKIIQHQTLIKNPDYVPTKPMIPFGERNKVFLNIALLLFIAIMGIFGFFWMKNTHHE